MKRKGACYPAGALLYLLSPRGAWRQAEMHIANPLNLNRLTPAEGRFGLPQDPYPAASLIGGCDEVRFDTGRYAGRHDGAG